MIAAQTGTGKTLAYALPVAQRIEGLQGPFSAAVMLPNTELVLQTASVFEELGMRCTTAYTGQKTANYPSSTPSEEELCTQSKNQNADNSEYSESSEQGKVFLGTPTRFFKEDLSDTKFFVIDEIDTLLDAGFKGYVEKCIQMVKTGGSTLIMVGATFPQNPATDRCAFY